MRENDPQQKGQEQKLQGMMTILAMVMVILLIQLWLLTIALEEFMAARSLLALPTFLASGGCFLLNLWLLRYLNILDRNHRG